MRRKEKEIHDKRIIGKILSDSTVCRIAMIDGDKPYIVPLNYGYFENAIYFHSAPEGKKIDLLKQNNKVCFEIENHSEIIMHELPCDCGTKYRSVIGYGTIEIITDLEEKKKGLDIIMSHHGGSRNHAYKDKDINSVLILKLNIETITGKQSGDWE
jgi:uncharacterized protein